MLQIASDNVYPCVPKKIIGTLTLNISTLYLYQYLKYFGYKSCSVATPKHFEPLLLEIYIRVVAITPDLRRVPFYSVIKFLHHQAVE